MATTSISTTAFATAEEKAVKSVRLIPTYVIATVFASLSVVVGLLWDISWHISIGRDGLFSPPHLAIYLGAVIAGVFSGYNVLRVSFFGTKEEKASYVKFWGIFYSSLGAMFCIWGAFAMLTSAPFDDWWHNTYGLDVTILSPPHTVLALGIIMVQFGALISVIALQNRLSGKISDSLATRLNWMYAASAGFLLVMVYTLASEFLDRNNMHGTLYYQISMTIFPIFMVAIGWASPAKWGATKMALVYMLSMAVMVWILPLFEAEPLLGPIYNRITNFQPYHFPMVLIVPAVAIDFLMEKYKNMNHWLLALLIAGGFLLLLFPTQWLMGDLLMSPVGRTWFFGQESWYYGANPDYEYRFAFAPWSVSSGSELIKGLLIALGLGYVSTRVGLVWGNWMKKIQR